MSERRIENVRATHPTVREGWGTVELYGFARWIKSAPMISAVLTPRQARDLAVDLLRSAALAEDYNEAQEARRG